MRLFFFSLLILFSVRAVAQNTPYETGIQLFTAGDYKSADKAFEKAATENPTFVDAYLWRAIAIMATGQSAGHIFLKIPTGHVPFHLTKYLSGLYYWSKLGVANQNFARGYFKDALKEPSKSLGYQLSKNAINSMDKNESAPPVLQWPKLVQLKGADGKAVAIAASDGDAVAVKENTSSGKGLESLGGKLTIGKYACRDFAWEQMKHPSEYGTNSRSKWSTQFVINDNSSYSYMGTKKIPGTYTYDLSTGKMVFKSGPFAPGKNGSSMRAEYGTLNGKPVILLYFTIPKYPETCEICFLQNK